MTTIDRIQDESVFRQMQPEWNALLQASASKCFFLTWEWLYTCWKHLAAGRELSLITIRSNDELVAIAPLALSRRWRRPASLEFLGTGQVGSDYLDFIIRQGKEEAMIPAFAHYLADRGLALKFPQTHRNGSTAGAVASELVQLGCRSWKTPTHICPYIQLAGHSWESYLGSLGSQHRYTYRRKLRNLEKDFEVRFQLAASEEDRAASLKTLIRLHSLRWDDRAGGSDAFHTSALLAFHEELSGIALQRGWLRLFVLWLDGKPAASLYGFRYGRVFYFYQSGLDPAYSRYSVGLVLMGLAIKSALEEGVDEYDLLHGTESYKYHWTLQTRELERIEIYPASFQGWLQQNRRILSWKAKGVVRNLLPRQMVESIIAARDMIARKGVYASKPD